MVVRTDVGASVMEWVTRIEIAGVVGGAGGRIEPVKGARTRDVVGGSIFFGIGVPGGMSGVEA